MSILLESVKRYIGIESKPELACDVVERGSVRRYSQAIMDEDPIFNADCEGNTRYGGCVAPPLYPTHLFRRPFGDPDPIQENAHDPSYDGSIGSLGLPAIEPLKDYALLNGGSEVEFFRYARHGESITMQSRYADILERETSKGPIILVIIESEFRNEKGDLLIRTRRTQIRRR